MLNIREAKNVKVVCESYVKHNEEFVLCSCVVDSEIRYAGINKKFIGEDGRLVKPLNGLDIYLSESVNELCKRIDRDLACEHYAKHHRCSKFVASLILSGMPRKKALEIEKAVCA